MRVLLINVCHRPDSPIKYIPVGLSCIATALDQAGFKPDILDLDLHRYTDEEVDDFLAKNAYEVVGLGNIVTAYKYTKKLSQQVKRAQPNTMLVVGNTVATSHPGHLMKHNPEIDVAVIGEGDRTIVSLVQAKIEQKRNGSLKPELASIPGIAYRDGDSVIFTEKNQAIPKIEDVPFPDYSLFDVDEYLKISNKTVPEPYPLPFEELRALPLNTARGCPYTCSFCFHAFQYDRYRWYSGEMIVNQVKHLQDEYGMNYLHFWDELSFTTVRRVKELCDAIEKAKIKFYWSVGSRADLFTRKDLDLLKRCKDLGALTVGGALESAHPEILKAMNKQLEVGVFIEQMQAAREAGLAVQTSLVIGYPQETVESIKTTFEACRQAGIYPSTGFILPLPGTPIYQQALENGLIKDEEEYLFRVGDRQDIHVNLTQMPDELMIDTVKDELRKLRDEFGLKLSDDKLIKTGVYRKAKQFDASKIAVMPGVGSGLRKMYSGA